MMKSNEDEKGPEAVPRRRRRKVDLAMVWEMWMELKHSEGDVLTEKEDDERVEGEAGLSGGYWMRSG